MTMTKQGTYIIQASTVLLITLKDYHDSRQHYNNDSYNHSERNKNINEFNSNVELFNYTFSKLSFNILIYNFLL